MEATGFVNQVWSSSLDRQTIEKSLRFLYNAKNDAKIVKKYGKGEDFEKLSKSLSEIYPTQTDLKLHEDTNPRLRKRIVFCSKDPKPGV